MKKCICFAYYGDDKFLGWHSDSSGTITSVPKIYRNTEHQLKIIESNFKNKIKSIRESSFQEEKDKVKGIAVFKLLKFSSEEIIRPYGKIELRIVDCPLYDGPNPNYSKTIADEFRNNHLSLYHKWCEEQNLDPGIKERDMFGIALIDNYKTFESIYPSPEFNNWLYPDYDDLKNWALNEPQETIKFIEL